MMNRRDKFIFYFVLLVVIIPGAISFVVKVAAFFMVEVKDGLAGFALPYFNYLFIAIGFVFLFVWAYFKGHFNDIEKPALEMLEMNERFEKQEQIELSRRGERQRSMIEENTDGRA